MTPRPIGAFGDQFGGKQKMFKIYCNYVYYLPFFFLLCTMTLSMYILQCSHNLRDMDLPLNGIFIILNKCINHFPAIWSNPHSFHDFSLPINRCSTLNSGTVPSQSPAGFHEHEQQCHF